MADLSVIVRRVLRHRIKSGEGLQKVVGEFLGDNWQSMLSSNRGQRDGLVAEISKQIHLLLNDSSFIETGFRGGDTSIDLNRQTVIS